MHTLLNDIRYAIRFLIKSPSFTIIAILTLTLAIGMNVAIFSVFNTVLLRALPFAEPEQLVTVSATVQRENLERRSTSYPDFLDWQKRNTVFSQMAAYAGDSLTLNSETGAEQIRIELVSANYFQLLGIRPINGRTFHADEDRMPASSAVAMISFDFWKRHFGSDPNIIGKNIRLNNRQTNVIGILPEGFSGLQGNRELWIPFSTYSLFQQTEILTRRGSRWHNVIARIKPGITMQQAEASMKATAKRLQEEYPTTNLDYSVMLIPFHEEVLGFLKSAVKILLGAVAFVLLIACVNVTNLMLARTSGRQKEFAVRTALGASRIRIIRQLITETVLLGTTGGIAGSLLALWAIQLLKRFSPVTLPSYAEIEIDGTVLIFTIAISFFSGLFIGLFSAIRITAHDPQASLKEAAVQSTETRSAKSLRGILVISETALALILLIGGGLMIQSLKNMQQIPIGFKKDHLLTMILSLSEQKYSDGRSTEFARQLMEEIEGLPSIRSVAVASDLPFAGFDSASIVTLDGTQPPQSKRIYRHLVTPNYFSTLGVPIINGRAFTDADTAEASPIAIVSDKMARKFWPNEDPVGKRFKFGQAESENPWITVAGVAAEMKHRVLISDPLLTPDDPDLYLPLAQREELSLFLLIRTHRDPAAMTASVQRAIRKLDRDVPIYGVSTMDELLADQTAGSRFNSFLMSIFGGFALLLACIGLYGVLSYAVTQRTREIGLRIALGAQRSNVFLMVLRQVIIWMALGLASGLIGAIALSRVLRSELYAVSHTDPATYAVLSLLLVAVAIVATCIPARRATRVDPIISLRYE